MGPSRTPRFTDSESPRSRILAVFLSVIAACDSGNEKPQQPQIIAPSSVSASASASASALAAPANTVHEAAPDKKISKKKRRRRRRRGRRGRRGRLVGRSQRAETVKVEDSSAPGKKCPKDMVNVKSFCTDRHESTLVDKEKHRAFSIYYSPVKKNTNYDFTRWSKLAGTSKKPKGSKREGDLLDWTLKVPSPPTWQMKEDVEPMALSRPGVLPQGYVNDPTAKKACKNAGKRLCTRVEWETACRGEEDRDFPYGDTYERGKCNVYRWAHPAHSLHGDASRRHRDPRLHLVTEKGRPLLRRTGATASCVSKWGNDGIFDMVGNLDERLLDSPEFRGGFYSRNTKDGCNAATGSAHPPGYYDYSTGFRCCL